LALVFTDGFGMADFADEAALLHRLFGTNIYAIAVDNNRTMPVAPEELARISGDRRRVFMENNLAQLDRLLREEYFQRAGC
jgi:hypothetical protein